MKHPIAALALVVATAHAYAADGEVRKIDKAQAKITLKHGEIKTLDMPPMTMVFRVKNPAVLDRVSVGDRVKFEAEKIDGQYVLTTLTPQK